MNAMKAKKLLKLINDERKQPSISSPLACDAISTDVCWTKDMGDCTMEAEDVCNYDYTSCYGAAKDFIGFA